MKQLLDSRILGAIRFADAVTDVTVQRPLTLDFGALHVVRNRSGVYVVRRAPGMDALSQSFDLTGVPAITSADFPIMVSDPQRFYLPRTASVTLPRSTNPADTNNVFQAQEVKLYPAPAATGRPTWASVFVTVVAKNDPKNKLAWALIQAQQVSDSKTLASSFTDQRGEAQLSLPVPGIHPNTAGGTSVVAAGTALSIVAIYDPQIQNKGPKFIPDPDDLLARAGDPSMKHSDPVPPVTVQAGQTMSLPAPLTIALS